MSTKPLNPNRHRVKRIRQTINAHYDVFDNAASVIDLLADIRHFCNAKRLEFHTLERIAHSHYAAEHQGSRQEKA